MIERDALMELAEHEDDEPVAICLVPLGMKINWQSNSPDEVLYIPESQFSRLGKNFCGTLTLDEYYDQKVIDSDLESLLLHSIRTHLEGNNDTKVLEAVIEFFTHAKSKQNSHYVMYEGP